MPTKPMDIIRMIQSGQNPQQVIMNILENQMKGNPVYDNLLALAKQNKTGEIEQIARNMFNERGLDFDKEFNSFKQQLGL